MDIPRSVAERLKYLTLAVDVFFCGQDSFFINCVEGLAVSDGGIYAKPDRGEFLAHLFMQFSLKQGLEKYGDKGERSVMKELGSL